MGIFLAHGLTPKLNTVWKAHPIRPIGQSRTANLWPKKHFPYRPPSKVMSVKGNLLLLVL